MEGAKILVIDDESRYRDLMRDKLESEGFEVILACDGEEGLERARGTKPDLIICDMKMPKKDGFDVLKALRKDSDLHTPFIMLTAVDDFENIKSAYEYEANFYVTKPVFYKKLFDSTNLMKNIRLLLSFPDTRRK
jgi:CheY-like chemotaxis protein